MGFSEKSQVDFELDSDNKKWVIAGIPLRAPLKPICTFTMEIDADKEEKCSTTPTGEESRIQKSLICPPAPRKRKASLKCKNYSGVKEFFTPPDLDAVFIRRHVERAN